MLLETTVQGTSILPVVLSESVKNRPYCFLHPLLNLRQAAPGARGIAQAFGGFTEGRFDLTVGLALGDRI